MSTRHGEYHQTSAPEPCRMCRTSPTQILGRLRPL